MTYEALRGWLNARPFVPFRVVTSSGDAYEIRCDAADFIAVRSKLQEAGIAFTSAELTMIPKNTVALDESDARKTLRLLDAL